MSCEVFQAFRQYMEERPQRMKEWMVSLCSRWRTWYGGLKAQLAAPWPWHQRLGAAARYLVWWGWPFGWRRWWRWVQGGWQWLWYIAVERMFYKIVIWSPLVLIVLLLWSIISAYAKDPSWRQNWMFILPQIEISDSILGIGILISALSFFLQYRNRILQHRAEKLQSQWDQQSPRFFMLDRQPSEELWPIGEWLRLPDSLRRRYPLAGLDFEEAWFLLLENLLQRFRSVQEGDTFFKQTGLDSIWDFLSVRFPHSRVWDTSLLIQRLWQNKIFFSMEVLCKRWGSLIAMDKVHHLASRQRILMSWLLASALAYVYRTQVEEEELFAEWLSCLLEKYGGQVEQRARDLGRDERLPLTIQQNSRAVLRVSGSLLITSSLVFRRGCGSLSSSPITIGDEDETMKGIWYSSVVQDRKLLCASLYKKLSSNNSPGYLPVVWRKSFADSLANSGKLELILSLAEAWVSLLANHPEYFLHLSLCRQQMLLDLFFAAWRTTAKVQDVFRRHSYSPYFIHERSLERDILLDQIWARVAGHIPQLEDEVTWSEVARWLHLKVPYSAGIFLILSSDLGSVPSGFAQPEMWAWLTEIEVPFTAIVDPQHLPPKSSISSEVARRVPLRPIRWKAQDILEAWNRQWRQAYGLSVAQEIPWTAFFPPEERARLKRWEEKALWYAQGSWSRFVEFMQRQARQLDRDTQSKLLDDERKRRIFGL